MKKKVLKSQKLLLLQARWNGLKGARRIGVRGEKNKTEKLCHGHKIQIGGGGSVSEYERITYILMEVSIIRGEIFEGDSWDKFLTSLAKIS